MHFVVAPTEMYTNEKESLSFWRTPGVVNVLTGIWRLQAQSEQTQYLYSAGTDRFHLVLPRNILHINILLSTNMHGLYTYVSSFKCQLGHPQATLYTS